jgi:hypothetical protein
VKGGKCIIGGSEASDGSIIILEIVDNGDDALDDIS